MGICVTNWKSDDLPNLSELTKKRRIFRAIPSEMTQKIQRKDKNNHFSNLYGTQDDSTAQAVPQGHAHDRAPCRQV